MKIQPLLLTTLAVVAYTTPSPISARKVAEEAGYYTNEYHKLYNAKAQAIPNSNRKPEFGMLPEGTNATIRDKVDAVLLGDSFAAPLAGVFNDIAREKHMTFAVMSHPSCAAFFDTTSMNDKVQDWPKANAKGAKLCKNTKRPDMLALVKHTNAKTVFLAANWIATPQIHNAMRGDRTSILDTLKLLRDMGKHVIVFGVVPGSHYNIRECLATNGPMSALKRCTPQTRILPPFQGPPEMRSKMELRMRIRDALHEIMRSKAVRDMQIGFVDPFAEFCPKMKLCDVAENDEPLYSDAMHLTSLGGKKMRKAIERHLTASPH